MIFGDLSVTIQNYVRIILTEKEKWPMIIAMITEGVEYI